MEHGTLLDMWSSGCAARQNTCTLAYGTFHVVEVEQPWIETRGDLNVNERCDKVITPELMIEYYGKKWETIKS